MENKVKIWIARDKRGSIFAFSERPKKYKGYWTFAPSMRLDKSIFPSVKWEDNEPTEAYITLANVPQEQPQPAKQIDWEQRKFEIIKDNLFHCPITDNLDEYKSYIMVAVKRAEILINELKKQSDEL